MTNPVSDSRKIVWPYLFAALLSLVGLGDAIYLTIQDLTGQNLRCTIITGCAEVLGSRYAHIGLFRWQRWAPSRTSHFLAWQYWSSSAIPLPVRFCFCW